MAKTEIMDCNFNTLNHIEIRIAMFTAVITRDKSARFYRYSCIVPNVMR